MNRSRLIPFAVVSGVLLSFCGDPYDATHADEPGHDSSGCLVDGLDHDLVDGQYVQTDWSGQYVGSTRTGILPCEPATPQDACPAGTTGVSVDMVPHTVGTITAPAGTELTVVVGSGFMAFEYGSVVDVWDAWEITHCLPVDAVSVDAPSGADPFEVDTANVVDQSPADPRSRGIVQIDDLGYIQAAAVRAAEARP